MSNDHDQRLITNEPQPTNSAASAPSSGEDAHGEPQRGTYTSSREASEAVAGGRIKLRRWSVAELIARAVPRAPVGGIAP